MWKGILIVTLLCLVLLCFSRADYARKRKRLYDAMKAAEGAWVIVPENHRPTERTHDAFDAGDMTLIRHMHVMWVPVEAGGPVVHPQDIFGRADAVETAVRLTGLSSQEATLKLRRLCVRLPDFITKARLASGEYTIPEEFRAPFADPVYGVDKEGSFTMTARHLKLLQAGLIWESPPDDDDEDEDYWPIPGIDFKRPYGDYTYYMYEMADLLGEPYVLNAATNLFIEDEAKDAAMEKLHHELLGALQVLLLYGDMPNGLTS